MKSADITSQLARRRTSKVVDRKAIVRAVASSTAIETGQSVAEIERALRGKKGKFRHIELAS